MVFKIVSTCMLLIFPCGQYQRVVVVIFSFSRSGPSCSKLTTSLVNVSLKFQTLILQIHCYFLLKKCENPLHCKGFSHFSTKNNSVFVTFADICLTNLCLNDIVKLRIL